MPASTSAVKKAAVMALVRQFSNPHGPAGNVAGWVMAHRSSNRKRNTWAVSLLDVRPGERVLEVGFGPGLAVAELSRRVGPQGQVRGVDRSAVMLRHASRRNAAGIRTRRIQLAQAPVEGLPPLADGPFDAVLTVNSFAFWPAPVERLTELRRRIAPGGRLAIVSQPRHPGATRDPELAAREKTDALRAAGFAPTRTAALDLEPAAICVIAVNPVEAPEETGQAADPAPSTQEQPGS